MTRSCGSCTLCCKLLGVIYDDGTPRKPQGKWCHLCEPKVGCRAYEQRPQSCRVFDCGWLQGLGSEAMRPDKCHAVLVGRMGSTREGWEPNQPVLTVHVDPRNPESWKQGPLGRYVETVLSRGAAVVIVTETRRTLLTNDPRLIERAQQAMSRQTRTVDDLL